MKAPTEVLARAFRLVALAAACGAPAAAADSAAAGKVASTPPPVQIGPVDVSAQVTVTFVYAPPAGP